MFDLAIIGGGINGCGVARDASGRGLSVLLVEQGDLASATSSASTKLIHGGLRYLEHYAFRLVHEALAEREVLLRAAPHLIRPMRFILPHHAGLRPWWLIRAGLFLYDHLGGRKILPGTRSLDLRNDPILRPEYTKGFEYSDCTVDDSRLVILNARDAAARGADIRPRTRCIGARRIDGVWHMTLEGGTTETARVLVDAAGPWVTRTVGKTTRRHVRLVKGSHIVVPRLHNDERSYILQNADGRVCFVIPYQADFTLIGTTDEDYHGDPADVSCTDEEAHYLCSAVGEYVRHAPSPSNIVWRYAGVRPLLDDGASKAQEATRDYVLELNGDAVLSVFGGKITTYRRLAEAAMAKLAPQFPNLPGSWTANASLPGGDFPWDSVNTLRTDIARRYPFLKDTTIRRLVHAYGTLTTEMLGDARRLEDLGQAFGADLTEREVDWLANNEWARTTEDILWRRSKLGLRISANGLNAYFSSSNKIRFAAPSISSY
ncbi:MAG TPA: glycerol-3-phosphate dehydrogenase [Acetobacteraceae bacterium]|nr:glycerol-3-phosphate dehydrogenase [Acetobacteraceae bacterium]